jgi:hypothetical protein
VPKDIAADLGVLQTLLERLQPFLVLGKKGDRYPVHEEGLNEPGICML